MIAKQIKNKPGGLACLENCQQIEGIATVGDESFLIHAFFYKYVTALPSDHCYIFYGLKPNVRQCEFVLHALPAKANNVKTTIKL